MIRTIENLLERFLDKTGILPKYGSYEYHPGGLDMEQFGDVRDCDNPEEEALWRLHFPDKPLSTDDTTPA